MILKNPLSYRQAAAFFALVVAVFNSAAFAEWERTETSIAWKRGEKVLWRFSFDPEKGKPFFDPLSAGDGPALTNFKPADHPWHYGLWFSWKYINKVNYWEEDRTSGSAGGKTSWKPPTIDARPDGSAKIRMELSYDNRKGSVDLTETRELAISTPTADGAYTIDWTQQFIAGKDGAELDRTPMPGEPNGAVNGGYAGLSVRMAGQPLLMSVMTPAGPVTQFVNSRARPDSPSVGCNFRTPDGRDVGGIAVFSDPANIRADAPWYLINNDVQNNGEGFRFACAAILAPQILKLEPQKALNLRYRVALSPRPWTADSLTAMQAQWQTPTLIPSR